MHFGKFIFPTFYKRNSKVQSFVFGEPFKNPVFSPFGLPHVKLPSEQLHLGLGCLCLKVQPSLAATVTPATISKTFEILVQSASADDKDVIISALLFGLCTWKHFVGENLLLLLPANVYNMREKTFKDFHGFPLKFDIESIHRGIGKKSVSFESGPPPTLKGLNPVGVSKCPRDPIFPGFE